MVKEIEKAAYQGDLDLNGFELTCAVLKDGTRLFSERSLATAFGIKGGGAFWKKKREGKNKNALLPEYLSAGYLKPFISDELAEKFNNAIVYKAVNGTESTGVDATVLPEICDVYIQAEKSGITNENVIRASEVAYTLIKGFAKVGIIALVDEVTGYQYERERDALQSILKAYISEELLPWQKRFPDEYYKEIFRLNGWNFTIGDIKKRPGVIGHWTNSLVYDRLPKGVTEELKSRTPKSKEGNYTARFHQSLSLEIGEPHLEKQLVSVITLMKISDNWNDFMYNFNKVYGQRELFDSRTFETHSKS